uniref:Elongation of very long chain fatty acids protein n=1 Tax=Timema shepardi TaxID=629360 RepID=A0A7R9G062_TIMSH|nr:unnamed protein product [Timema shepardi]
MLSGSLSSVLGSRLMSPGVDRRVQCSCGACRSGVYGTEVDRRVQCSCIAGHRRVSCAKHKSKVDAVGIRYLRNVYEKTHMDRVSNEWVLKECGLKGNSIDPRVKNWPLIGSPVYLLVIIALYLFFVLVAGPKFMKNRRPYNLKKIIAAYNIFQVVANSYAFYGVYKFIREVKSHDNDSVLKQQISPFADILAWRNCQVGSSESGNSRKASINHKSGVT